MKRFIGIRGFTLIELMIVVAIIGILASIAIPNFLRFQAKAKQAEAKANLASLHTAQMAYFGEYNTYADSGVLAGRPYNAFELCNFRVRGPNRYRYACASADFQAYPKPTTCSPTADNDPVATRQGFTGVAVSNIDSDPFCDSWAINDDRIMRNRYATSSAWGANGNDAQEQ